MTSQMATLDSLHALTWFVSYWRLSPQFQFSLSVVTLGIYLSDPTTHSREHLLLKQILSQLTQYTKEKKKTRDYMYNYIYVDSKSFVSVPLKQDGSILCTFLQNQLHLRSVQKEEWSPIWSVKRENKFLSKVRDMAVYMIDLGTQF